MSFGTVIGQSAMLSSPEKLSSSRSLMNLEPKISSKKESYASGLKN